MQVYVDFVRATGLYESALEPSWLDLRAPAQMLTAPAFLRAAGLNVVAYRRRLLHVESLRFVGSSALTSLGLCAHDSLVVVNSDELLYDDPRAVATLWELSQGRQRRATARLSHRLAS